MYLFVYCHLLKSPDMLNYFILSEAVYSHFNSIITETTVLKG